MKRLDGRIAWVTGAGSGIGEAAALALAAEGATVVLTGRRREPLESVEARITGTGGSALVQPADVTDAGAITSLAESLKRRLGKVDILVANAGMNVAARDWSKLTPEGIDAVIRGNLSSAFYCALAVLPTMRERHDGVVIITASVAGRLVGPLSGPAYTAAKHGVVAMSHSINTEECVNGIRCTAVLPGEVATPILDKRPVPVTQAERARMVQPEDVGDLIRYVATLPAHVVINEVMISPTWNRSYVAALDRSGMSRDP
jgi:NADP-dependent 3-hydroxy acid dehydrogenase YdfG